MYSSISTNKRNTVLIFASFIAIIGGIGLIFSQIYSDHAVFWTTLIVAFIYAGVEYFFSSKIAIKMSGAQQVTRPQAPELYAAVESISITAGIPMPKVYIINDPAPNAFAAGTKPDNALVCATTGLLDIMNKEELEGVVAHEISHIKNYDIRVSMAAFALTAAIGFLADTIWRVYFWSDNDDRSPIAMLIGIVIAVIAPILALITQLAISRQREYLADASAVMLTRYPQGLISALEKLKTATTPMRKQSSSMANLYFTNPLKKGFMNKLFSTHPPLEERIAKLSENSSKF